jgi:hypothetical protein
MRKINVPVPWHVGTCLQSSFMLPHKQNSLNWPRSRLCSIFVHQKLNIVFLVTICISVVNLFEAILKESHAMDLKTDGGHLYLSDRYLISVVPWIKSSTFALLEHSSMRPFCSYSTKNDVCRSKCH